MAMVATGSGGAFNGITYHDDEGQLRTAADYILNRLWLAQGNQYICNFWQMRGFTVARRVDGNAGGADQII